MKKFIIPFLILWLAVFACYGEELPKPEYDNTFMLSMTHDLTADAPSETSYLKSQFGGGLYAKLLYSKFISVICDWDINPANIDSGLGSYQRTIDKHIAYARQNKIGVHFSYMHGVARKLEVYHPAKIEDLRNAQWYNDNNLYSQAQMNRTASENKDALPAYLSQRRSKWLGDGMNDISQTHAGDAVVNDYVFGTLSRYARKMRAHLEAKTAAAYAYVKKAMDDNPDVTIILSGPGEAELNFYRMDGNKTLQDYFCDFSPFAILEFRDWVKHEGMYATGGKYAGEGYSQGGSRYQGGSGLANFNADFGTSFTSWDLKYYNWSLSDPVDTNFTDSSNPDTKAIPSSAYSFNGMMPTSGSNYIAGGFDPPRTQVAKGTSAFYDLWELFRQTMVYNYVKDINQIAVAAGFPSNQMYTHQVPGDYLWGAYPDYPYGNNARYHISATPAWTADVGIVGMGTTCYDVHFVSAHARTSLYLLDELARRSNNWALLEYNPEVIPTGLADKVTILSVDAIYAEILKTYNKGAHLLSCYRWKGDNEWAFKGTNREGAAKKVFNAVKDKARKSTSTVFTPKKVESASISYSQGIVTLSWSDKIWTDLTHVWSDWGDFKEFVIYRGYSEGFAANSGSEIKRISSTSYLDTSFSYGTTVYYKIAAVNSSGAVGPVETLSVTVPDGQAVPVMSVNRSRLNFVYLNGGNMPPAQEFRVSNTGTGALNWTAAKNVSWLTCTPSSGINGATIEVTIDPTGLGNGTYNDTITISDPAATDSPKMVTVYLTVKSASQNQATLGSFDTPDDNSTVRSSIPVTGWAVDDVGIEKVEIWRDPAAGEGSALIKIDEANLVDGARADVEASFPDYPGSYKAGWGYMMLTNFIPNTGPFKIYAIATDASGKQTTIGSKTITLDNDGAFKPFGAIDSPGQGGTASGASFINWGWVLTPQPNSIPTDGSTINVFVDGQPVGKPTYGLYRKDIANFFPGYNNSNTASGYFALDTTQFNDGVYTIQWSAMDTGGNSDGIGSRFFTIQNSGTNRTAQRQTGRTHMHTHLFRQASDLDNVPFSRSPVSVKTGYNLDAAPQALQRNSRSDGSFSTAFRQLGRLEIHLTAGNESKSNGPGSTVYLGYLEADGELRPLPIGSRLDSQNGVFYWHAAPGFYGEYELVFLEFKGTVRSKRLINVTILPYTDPVKLKRNPEIVR